MTRSFRTRRPLSARAIAEVEAAARLATVSSAGPRLRGDSNDASVAGAAHMKTFVPIEPGINADSAAPGADAPLRVRASSSPKCSSRRRSCGDRRWRSQLDARPEAPHDVLEHCIMSRRLKRATPVPRRDRGDRRRRPWCPARSTARSCASSLVWPRAARRGCATWWSRAACRLRSCPRGA